MEKILEAKGISKSFGNLNILKEIDLSVSKGDVIAIIGPSGSGKTTLLRCLNFLERADSGTMDFMGKRIALSSADRKTVQAIRMRTGFVFQNYNLFQNKTVIQNVTAGLTIARKVRREDAEKTALALLEKVGLSDKIDAYPHELSGGQQQRVAIARSLASSPEIIYFDEPTSALDPELIGEVLAVMKQLADDGMTMIVVTHEMNFARNVSTRTIFMEDGRIVESAPSEEFFSAPKTERAREFINSILNR